MDSVPMVAITGQVPSKSIGTDAFQEADIAGITLPITKHNYLVTDPQEIPRTIAEAFHIAGTGRPGPVLVDVSKDALQAATTYAWPDRIDLPGYRPVSRPHGKQVREAARLIAEAKRPGAVRRRRRPQGARQRGVAGARRPHRRARRHDADGARRAAGQPPAEPGDAGHARHVAAVVALQKADLLVSLGARFDDRVTGRLDSFAPNAAIVHADIDPAEISKNRVADVPIVGDARDVLVELTAAVTAEHQAGHVADLGGWWSQLDELRARTRWATPSRPPARCRRSRSSSGSARSRGRGAVRRGRRPAPDVGRAVHPLRAAEHLDQLRRPRHDGLRGAGGDGCQGRPAGRHGVGDRRRRLLPDDEPGARRPASSTTSRSRSR
jgi:acetolactate synthase-1/2/3 large subunit